MATHDHSVSHVYAVPVGTKEGGSVGAAWSLVAAELRGRTLIVVLAIIGMARRRN